MGIASFSAHFSPHFLRNPTLRPPLARRLKIVRALEPGVGAGYAGRMVISGRMADVCAALDRMTQRETSS